jgi:hypothetical protein
MIINFSVFKRIKNISITLNLILTFYSDNRLSYNKFILFFYLSVNYYIWFFILFIDRTSCSILPFGCLSNSIYGENNGQH